MRAPFVKYLALCNKRMNRSLGKYLLKRHMQRFQPMNPGRYSVGLLRFGRYSGALPPRGAFHWRVLCQAFGCPQQLICMAFAQLTWREGLRDIAENVNT